MERNSNIENDKARMELIDRLVQNASNKSSPSEKNSYYKSQLPKVKNFSLEDCIERTLDNQPISQSGANEVPGLRTFETLDFEALTKGFEPEELNEGKLVLYITEKQLLQLLKQRAIVVPNKSSLDDFSNKKFSLVDEKIGSRLNGRKGPSQVELVVNQNQPQLSKINESQEESAKKVSGRESLPRDAYNQKIYDSKLDKKTEYDQFYKEQYMPSKPSNKSGSILYEETFEHIRTVSEASGKDNLPNIKPGSTSISDDYYAKFGSRQYPRLSQQYDDILKDQKNQGYQVLNQNNYPNSKSNVVTTQGYPDMTSQIYSSDRKNSSIRLYDSTAQSYVDNAINQGFSNVPSQYTGARIYSKGNDGYSQTLDSRQQNNIVSSDGGLQGSVYIGDNYSNQSNIINDVLKTATKITNGIDYTTVVSPDGLNNLASTSWSNMYPSVNYTSQAKDIENQALTELDKLVSNLSTNVKDDKIDWAKVQDGYTTEDALDKAGLMKNYVSSLIEHETAKSKQLEQLDNAFGQKFGQDIEKLKTLDGFIDRVVNKNEIVENRNESASHSINLVNDLVSEIKNNVRSRNLQLEDFKTGHKIIIKTTRRLPPKVISQSAINVANCNSRSSLGKRRVSSSYLNGSKARIYELGASKKTKQSSNNTNLFNSKQTVDYSVHSYEPIIDSSLGKASNEKINKYLSVINTGIKNNDLIQIHPLLNNKTEINTKTNSGKISPSLSVKEPVIIGSNNYLEEVSKHFGGLKVTDFPLYVQGLEFKKSNKSKGSSLKKSQSIVKQTVNNSNNIQFVKVNSAVPVSQSNPIKAQ